MAPEQFFGACWRGEGAVSTVFGRVLRQFTVELDGRWSDEHRAFHVDEIARYADGGVLERRWAIHTDGEGVMLGVDAMQASRIRVRPRREGFRIAFDRPGLVRGPAPRAIVLDIVARGPDHLSARGWVRVLGAPVASTKIEFERLV